MLTEEQIADIQAEAARWMEIGLATERCDRTRAEAAVKCAYATTGLAEPKTVVWMDSPLGERRSASPGFFERGRLP